MKKSHFIAYLAPMRDFKSLHVKLKEEHPKANHIVWAMRYLNEFDQIVENSSDDGEPKGTSGPPILNVLRGAELIEYALLVVRYFGGIKLGTGGLVRAYGTSAKEVIAIANLIEYVKKTSLKVHIPFHLIARFEHFLESFDLEKIEKSFNEHGGEYTLMMSEKEREKFLHFALSFEIEGFRVL